MIGAGFATGQEIYTFFGKYGLYGILGIIISSFIISYILYIVLTTINKYGINNYENYMDIIFKGNKFSTYLNQNIISIFLLLSFYVMQLGFASLLYQQYNVPKFIGIGIISFLSYIVFKGSVKSLVKVNMLLTPILITTIIYISISGIIKFIPTDSLFVSKLNWEFLIDSLIYGSYNFIMLLPLVIGLKEKNLSKKEIKLICFSTFFVIFILSVLILILLNLFDIQKIEIPIIYIANFIGSTDAILGVILILLAIFTSVICIGYSFLNNISKNEKTYKRNSLIMCAISMVFINSSFASTMKIIYTFLGILGIIQIFAIILAKFRKN